MQQPDNVMHDRHHRLAARLGIAVGDLHRDLFMIAEQHRRLVLAIIHQRVVQTAIARAGVERDIGKLVLLDQIDDDVGLPALGGFFYLSLCHTDILLGDGYKSALSAIFLKPLVIWETNEPQELPAARSARFKVPGSKFNDFPSRLEL